MGVGGLAVVGALAAGFSEVEPRTISSFGSVVAIATVAGFFGTEAEATGCWLLLPAGAPNSWTTKVVRRPWYIPCAVAMPISVKCGSRIFPRWVGEFIQAVFTSLESEKSIARLSPAN